MQKLNLTLALAAGLLGGFLSRITLPAVHAQNPAPPAAEPAPEPLRPPQLFPGVPPVPPLPQPAAAATKEVRAQSFTLVDSADRTVGTFTVDPSPSITRDGRINQGGRIVLRDATGREIWSAGAAFRPAATQ